MLDIIATVRRDQEKPLDVGDYKKRIEFLMCHLNITNFRINVGKWDPSEFDTLIEDVGIIRKIADENFKKVTIILDIPFPGKKARVSTYARKVGLPIHKNRKYKIYSANEMELGRLLSSGAETDSNNFFGVSFSNIGELVRINDDVLYADGEGHFIVNSVENSNCIIVLAKNKFSINNAKSIHFRNSVNITELDKSVIQLIHNICPDFVALSFVENTDDVLKMREALARINLDCRIMAKIETEKGVKNIDQLLEFVDAIMIGRGDLGLHLDVKEFPVAIESIIQQSQKKNKYVCVATGFMDSYVHQTIPSRSDIMDLYYTIKSQAYGIVFTYNTVRDYNKIKDIVDIIHSWT